jgi:predicted nucleotidyltransferase
MSAYVRKKRIYGSQRTEAPLDVLASRPAVRILRYLAAHPGEHTGRQVGRSTDVAPSRAAEALSKLVDMGVLQRRAAGRAYLYSLNETNYLVRDVLLPAFRGEARWLEALGNEVLTALNRTADSVLLYGSWARGQTTPTSDVDLLVVSRTRQAKVQAERFLESQRGQLAERFGHPVSLLVVTRNELLKRLRRGDRLIKDVIREGRALAGKSIAEVVGGA